MYALSIEGENGGKQPNFLEKLYESVLFSLPQLRAGRSRYITTSRFLAMDPHPCPEIMYWANDSRQLVIAQPDRLAKEVLPRLFKHDKLASFGRQLNVGGRDEKVMSPPGTNEYAQIYGFSRLFPGRQFKDADGHISDASVWAHPTLHRESTASEVASIKRRAAPKLIRTRRLANGQIVRSRAGPAVEAKFREVRENIAESRKARNAGPLGVANFSLAGTGANSTPPDPLPSSLDGRYRLADITEDLQSGDYAPVFPTSAAEHQGLQLQPWESRPFQSCPASLHSSPIQSPFPAYLSPDEMFLSQPQPIKLHNLEFNPFLPQLSASSPMQEYQFEEPEGYGIPSAALRIDTQASQKIAAPAARPPLEPFQSSPGPYAAAFSSHHSNTPTSARTQFLFTPSLTGATVPSSWGSREASEIPINHSQETIDPKWVSPMSSVWSTPRGLSPVLGEPMDWSPSFPSSSLDSQNVYGVQGEELLETVQQPLPMLQVPRWY
ncbi:hypothetical protein P7C73_g5324, partial [Tremellales sp. Uapishka_1]